jgi:hypothetical protein
MRSGYLGRARLFTIYEPTKKCLEPIRDRLTKGSILGFDELNVRYWPGETLALKEVFGLDRCQIRHSPSARFQPTSSSTEGLRRNIVALRVRECSSC